MRLSGTPIQRLLARVEPEPNTGCWLYSGASNTSGYGEISIRHRMALAHRVSYEAVKGPIPAGLHVLHSCDTPACVNPDHLSVGTHADNMLDGYRKGRVRPPINGEQSTTKGMRFPHAVCRRGHAMTPENVIHDGNAALGKSRRRCLACLRARQAERRRLRSQDAARPARVRAPRAS